MAGPLPVILDADPGVDDALAMLLAVHSPELEVRAVTTVSGNVPVERATDNALRVLELAGRAEVGVYGGADGPLEGEAIHAEHIHGRGGLGEANLAPPGARVRGDAVELLTAELWSTPGALVVIATGPLTNLAAAERRCPGLLRRARQVIVMGGAVHVAGNASPGAEFNFLADPQAAREVLHSGAPLLLVPLDATRQVRVSPAELERISTAGDERVGAFAGAAAATPMAAADREYGSEGLYLHDVLAVALAVFPQLAGRTGTAHLDVETRGELTAGQVVSDERPFADARRRRGCPVEWVRRVDRKAFLRLFAERVFGAGVLAGEGAA